MYPGLNHADCQVATLRHRDLVGEGQRRQFEDARMAAGGTTRVESGSVRRRVGAVLVCVGQRLQGVRAVTGEGHTGTGEMGAIA